MDAHDLRKLENEEQVAIETIMAEFKETHRTFNHLVGELEELEALTRLLENESDGTARMRLIKAHGGSALVSRLNATLNRLLHDEEELLRSSKHIHHRVAADILKALKSFEQAH
jgi:hypothetical protein